MARYCKYCNELVYPSDIMCLKCRKKWIARRKEIWNEALDKYGKVSVDNLKDLQKYCKKQERLRPMETWEPKDGA